jgi:hypothetical protein
MSPLHSHWGFMHWMPVLSCVGARHECIVSQQGIVAVANNNQAVGRRQDIISISQISLKTAADQKMLLVFDSWCVHRGGPFRDCLEA